MFEEGLPFGFPPGELARPGGCLLEGADVGEHLVDREEFLVRRQVRSSGEVLIRGLPDMEVTPLDAGAWPQSFDRRCQRPVAIDDRGHGGGNALNEGSLGRGLFLVAPLPVDEVLAGVGDENAPSVEVDAI